VLKLLIPTLFFASANALAASSSCENVESYAEASKCLQAEVSRADAAMQQYLTASKKRHAADRSRLDQIESSQSFWLKLEVGKCRRVNLLPRDQDKHTAEILHCLNRMTRERTHQIWERFLKNQDGAPPVLPEPER
jgi:uncharacterized protein YecT (DUF1311 family)